MMAPLLRSKTLNVSIDCDPKTVYEFVSNLENFPKWAETFCLSIRRSNGEWIVETPQGPVEISIAGKNDLGVLDHHVRPSAGAEVFVPMRVVPNGSGSEVLFTLFQLPGVSDESYAEDIRLVEQDLRSLKSVMEG